MQAVDEFDGHFEHFEILAGDLVELGVRRREQGVTTGYRHGRWWWKRVGRHNK